jgi:hypothetical protein
MQIMSSFEASFNTANNSGIYVIYFNNFSRVFSMEKFILKREIFLERKLENV